MADPKLPNLAELDRLEEKAYAEEGRGDDIIARRALDAAARSQLRPLLDLVDRLGRLVLLSYNYIERLPNDVPPQDWAGHDCNWCDTCVHRLSEEQYAAWEDYQRAKGK